MPQNKRVNNASLPKAQIKTGRAKRGIVEPVAQVVEMNARKKPARPPRPIHIVLADVYMAIEKEIDMQPA